MRIRIAVAVVTLMFCAAGAQAAESKELNAGSAAAAAEPSNVVQAPAVLRTPSATSQPSSRPQILPGLYASFAALQIFDVYSTTHALAQGAKEANPVMQGVVGNPAIFWSVKAAATVAPMLAAERLWKTNRMGAIAVMIAGNGVMAAVAAHNASALNHQR